MNLIQAHISHETEPLLQSIQIPERLSGVENTFRMPVKRESGSREALGCALVKQRANQLGMAAVEAIEKTQGNTSVTGGNL
jgi:hypothetical protein